jgi:hypothetical protein
MPRKRIRPGEKVGLTLTRAEVKLVLDEAPLLDPDVEGAFRSTPPGEPVMLTLDDLDDFAGHVAAVANHAPDAKLRKRLDAIFAKIQDVLDTHTDEEPPGTLKIHDAGQEKQLTEQSVALVEWAAMILAGAEQLGLRSRPVSKFPLPERERAVLLMVQDLDEKVREKLAAKSPKLTVGEVGGLLMAVAEEILDAQGMQGFALMLTAKALIDCLKSEVEGAMEPKKAAPSTSVYRLRVMLADIEPPVWRLIEVPDCPLGELHEVIQAAMGWEGFHMHQFTVNGRHYGPATADMLDEDAILLSELYTGRKRPRISYEYDFGDGWKHEIRLEKTLEPEPKVKYPRCIDGARACPPEDCGGPWGYADLLEALADPKHPEHRDMKEWVGGKFDPEKFSADRVNRELRRYF